ncbi:probable F420-dependent oxidoreductase, MSMEG_2256 family [Rhodococcus koreensis]|uniref:Probable F420-dependent oxidoreductase, MSMEG_2256 family n=2 Tax=Rhodococcus koreensis TaxID=99653 RepID=A0A1H4L307_9NOCA|nr:probable F420-dependent oxidoreductase, MSMEG_2256 family [Rhodococcus koreensis]
MRIAYGLHSGLLNVGVEAARAHSLGFDTLATAEVAHDPFLPLVAAAPSAEGMTLQTRIAVAFARSPMILAGLARDLNVLCGGRFVLGLGTQTKAHITRRFDMSWSGRPATQMRDYISAMRAIWADWEGGGTLAYDSDHYRFSLMTDTFRPGPSNLPAPAVHLAAVGPAMTRLAGEICDGLIPHSFSTPAWFHEVTMPALRDGLDRGSRDRTSISVHCPGFVVVTGADGPTQKDLRAVRQQVAFYGSTPAYGDVLRFHGWAALHEQLHQLSRTSDTDRWKRMADLIDDEVLAAFGVIGSLPEVCTQLVERFGSEIDAVQFNPPSDVTAAEMWTAREILETNTCVESVQRADGAFTS